METEPHVRTSEVDLEPGYRVGEYVVEAKIGQGGFGTVFRAMHPLIGKLAAIKVLSRRYSADPEMVSRFAAEARAVNQIRHRNIIDIFAFGQLDDGRSYYVMELLDGQPLDKLLDDTGGVPLGDALRILRAVARALDAAHAKGIAHRDLKPENVFLARDPDGAEYPKLLDFGIAKLVGEVPGGTLHRTRTGAPIGTPFYMSPEQCRGQTVDHRTDIYAFGCVAYQLLTGSLPFEGDNHLEIMMKQTLEEPEPASTRAAKNPALSPLPPAIDGAIAWMLKKDPADRPPNLLTAIRALEEAAGIEVIAETTVSRRTPASGISVLPGRTPAFGVTALAQTIGVTPAPPARRKRWIVPVGIGLAALAGIAIWVAARGDRTPAPPPPPVVVAAPPVVSPPPPPPIVTPPPAPHVVTIHIAGVPANTQVFGPAGPLGTAPGDIQLVQGAEALQLTLVADGYATATKRVTPDRDASITVALVKKKKAAAVVATPQPKPPAVVPTPPHADPYSRE